MGAFLPSFTDFPAAERRDLLVRFANRAEELGVSSLWAEDHILRINTNPAYSGLAWLDPIATLSYVASHTSLPLGFVYCGCLRNPVISAKQVSTLMYLAPSSVIVVPVIGAWEREHEVAGIPRRERGARTDEWLDIIELLLSSEASSYAGRFWEFTDLTIDPIPDEPLHVWPSGGAAWYVEGVGPDEASLVEPVIQRILRFGAWCVSSTASPVKAAADRKRIEDYAADQGLSEPDLYVSHANFIHVVPTDDRQAAYEVQAPLLEHSQDPRPDIRVHVRTRLPQRLDRRHYPKARAPGDVVWPTGDDRPRSSWP